MNTNAIEFIVVRPKRHRKFIYYVNDNIDNGHYASPIEILTVIKELVSNRTIREVNDALQHHKMFVIDVLNDEYIEMETDSTEFIASLQSKIHGKEVMQNAQAEQKAKEEKGKLTTTNAIAENMKLVFGKLVRR